VNSFGYGGSNAHCILDHESVVNSTLVQPTATPTRRLVLLPFSAHDESSLRNNIDATRHALPNLPLADVAYTLSNRRSKFLYKTFAIVESTSPAQGLDTYGFIPKKSLSAQPTSVGFVFTGMSVFLLSALE
jgi:acyl transferase domain-containing protein